jgi:hypothetical protein
VGFPGGSAREVEETHGNIMRYAIAYDPLIVSQYGLEPHSVVFQLPERFGVTNIRNDEAFQKVLPPEVASELLLPWLDFDTKDDPADWTPAVVACDRWRELHERLQEDKAFPDIPKPLFYFDGGTFLEIIDRRHGFRTITLEKLYRDVYIYCMEIRSKARILEHFRGRASEETIVNAVLAACLAENLMFEEDGKHLSLAVAWRPSVATRRIRQQHDGAVCRSGNCA